MQYEAKKYNRLFGADGFSDNLLTSHFGLYEGYVKNVNTIADTLMAMLKEGSTKTPAFAELKRRFGWEFSGMRLHEYYFENMAKERSEPDKDSALARALKEQFGSLEKWEEDFKSVGAMRGIGWAILYRDPAADRLFNVWINEHDLGHIPGGKPILAMDVFEHAYVLDYGMKRADYIGAFFHAIDWGIVTKRYGTE